MKQTLTIVAMLFALTQTACVVVGGYSSRGGWFLWPGALGLLLMLGLFLLFVFGLRR